MEAFPELVVASQSLPEWQSTNDDARFDADTPEPRRRSLSNAHQTKSTITRPRKGSVSLYGQQQQKSRPTVDLDLGNDALRVITSRTYASVPGSLTQFSEPNSTDSVEPTCIPMSSARLSISNESVTPITPTEARALQAKRFLDEKYQALQQIQQSGVYNPLKERRQRMGSGGENDTVSNEETGRNNNPSDGTDANGAAVGLGVNTPVAATPATPVPPTPTLAPTKSFIAAHLVNAAVSGASSIVPEVSSTKKKGLFRLGDKRTPSTPTTSESGANEKQGLKLSLKPSLPSKQTMRTLRDKLKAQGKQRMSQESLSIPASIASIEPSEVNVEETSTVDGSEDKLSSVSSAHSQSSEKFERVVDYSDSRHSVSPPPPSAMSDTKSNKDRETKQLLKTTSSVESESGLTSFISRARSATVSASDFRVKPVSLLSGNQVKKDFDADEVLPKPLKVITSIDPRLQEYRSACEEYRTAAEDLAVLQSSLETPLIQASSETSRLDRRYGKSKEKFFDNVDTIDRDITEITGVISIVTNEMRRIYDQRDAVQNRAQEIALLVERNSALAHEIEEELHRLHRSRESSTWRELFWLFVSWIFYGFALIAWVIFRGIRIIRRSFSSNIESNSGSLLNADAEQLRDKLTGLFQGKQRRASSQPEETDPRKNDKPSSRISNNSNKMNIAANMLPRRALGKWQSPQAPPSPSASNSQSDSFSFVGHWSMDEDFVGTGSNASDQGSITPTSSDHLVQVPRSSSRRESNLVEGDDDFQMALESV